MSHTLFRKICSPLWLVCKRKDSNPAESGSTSSNSIGKIDFREYKKCEVAWQYGSIDFGLILPRLLLRGHWRPSNCSSIDIYPWFVSFGACNFTELKPTSLLLTTPFLKYYNSTATELSTYCRRFQPCNSDMANLFPDQKKVYFR